jgi:hypothetical protein
LKDNKLLTEMSENNKTISLKYKDKNIDKTLKEFIEFACKKVK